MKNLIRFAAIGAAVLVAASIDSQSNATAAPAPYSFLTMMGTPAAPQPWDNLHQGGWDVIVHTRSQGPDQNIEPMLAQHGPTCGAPPAVHPISSATDAVFICNNHVMTALSASDAGAIVLTAPQLVDFSGGTASIDFNVSTLQLSQDDWIELWITPFNENLVLPADSNTIPDLSGPPKDAIHVVINDPEPHGVYQISNYNVNQLPSAWQQFSDIITPQVQSAVSRTHFQVALSQTHVKYGALDYDNKGSNFWWTDANLPVPLDWTQGVVQLAAYSYEPTKAPQCQTAYDVSFNLPCAPDTWHWSNFSLSSAVPFTIDAATQRYLGGGNGNTATFATPTPTGGSLRFAAKGLTQVSFDGGNTWQNAARQSEQGAYNDCQFENYWMAIPARLTSVMLRGQPDCFGGAWSARDISVWSSNAPVPAPPAPVPSPTPSPTASPASQPVPLQHTPCTVVVNGKTTQGFCTGTFTTS